MSSQEHDPRPYLAALTEQRPEIVDLTAELVAIDSPTNAADGVAAVAARLAEDLRRRALDVTLTPLAGVGPALEATLRLGDGAHVLLLGHADTVWPVGTVSTWPFEQLPDGRLTGPGVGDMKVCLATAAAALGALVTHPPPGVGRITLLVVPDEEAGSTASRPLIERAAVGADACLTLEAARPGGGIVTSRGAVGAMVVRSVGRAQHVTDAGPHANALTPLVRLVTAIEQHDGATVGVLRAGTARQLVPDHGELHVDLRAPTTEAGEALAERIQSLAAAQTSPGVSLEVTGGVTRPAWQRTAGSTALFSAATTAAEALGIEIFEVAERGGSDASFAGALGIATLDGLGPPCHDCCSRSETVDADDIPPWGALLCALVAAAGR